MRTPEGRFVRLMMLVPIGIVTARAVLWYEPTMLFIGLALLSGSLACYEWMPRARKDRNDAHILQALFSIGVVPLLWTSYRLVTSSRDSLELTQREMQQDKARGLSSQVGLYVESLRDQVAVVSRTLEIDADRQPFSALVASCLTNRTMGGSGFMRIRTESNIPVGTAPPVSGTP